MLSPASPLPHSDPILQCNRSLKKVDVVTNSAQTTPIHYTICYDYSLHVDMPIGQTVYTASIVHAR